MSRIAGVITQPGVNATELLYFGLFVMQYGGTKSAGIVSTADHSFLPKTGPGLLTDVFSKEDIGYLKSQISIGFCGFGQSLPMVVSSECGDMAISFDGPDDLLWQFVNKLGRISGDLEHSLVSIAKECFGSYAIIISARDKIYALRGDGRRPLCFGKIGDNQYVIASQENAISTIEGRYSRNIEPGEMVIFGAKRHRSVRFISFQRCAHEIIFTQSPASYWNKRSIWGLRSNIGHTLGEAVLQIGNHVDLIYPIPHGGHPYAFGVYEMMKDSGVIFNPQGVLKATYSGQVMIGIEQKLTLAAPDELKGRSVVVVNDTLQSGYETEYVVGLCQKAGAKEVHVATASLALSYCDFGDEVPSDLIGQRRNWAEIALKLGATSFTTLRPNQIIKSIGVRSNVFCTQCLRP